MVSDGMVGNAPRITTDAESTALVEMQPKQKLAMEGLLMGKTVSDSAVTAGVSRFTLHRWIKSDPSFRAQYLQWLDEMHESCHARLMTLGDKATTAIEKALEAGDAKTALHILKGLGILKARVPESTDAEEIRQKADLDSRARQSELNRQGMRLKMEEDIATVF